MKIDPQLLEFAKSMRHTATDAEHLIWQLLRAKRFMSLKFRRQHVIKSYIVDFYCHEMALLHKDLKCKAPLIELILRRNLGKWST